MSVGSLPVDLDECSGQPFRLPRSARFAGAQPDRDILDPHRLARPKREVADDPVALVEQSQHGDALGHRRHPGLVGRRTRNVDRHRLIFGRLIALAATGRGQHHGKRKEGDASSHAYSGFHAS